MKFNTTKEMELELRKITSLNLLKNDITVISQGNTIIFKFIGIGSSAISKEASYLSNETADSLRIVFTGDQNIIISDVKLTRA